MVPIITLCGSTKFKEEFLSAAQRLGEQGWLVMSLTSFTHADDLETSAETSAILDAVHTQKILQSNAIFVINKHGYIGYSTLREIAFAAVEKLHIFFLEPPEIAVAEMVFTLGAKWCQRITPLFDDLQ